MGLHSTHITFRYKPVSLAALGDQWWTASLGAGQAIWPTRGWGAKRSRLTSETFLPLLADPEPLFPPGHAMRLFRSCSLPHTLFCAALWFYSEVSLLFSPL